MNPGYQTSLPLAAELLIPEKNQQNSLALTLLKSVPET
jgi:hypothetical protein